MRFRLFNTPRIDFSDGVIIQELCAGVLLVLSLLARITVV